eukprot:410927-Rhodomonas_salina.1
MGAEQSVEKMGMGLFNEENMFCCRGVSDKDAQKRGDFCHYRREPAAGAPARGWREERLMRLQQEANQNKARMSGVNEMEEDEANASHSAGYTRFTPHLYDTSFSARSQSLESSTHHSPASPLEQHVTPPRTQSYPVGVVAE